MLSVPSIRRTLPALGGAVLLLGCGPRADAPLPPETEGIRRHPEDPTLKECMQRLTEREED